MNGDTRFSVTTCHAMEGRPGRCYVMYQQYAAGLRVGEQDSTRALARLLPLVTLLAWSIASLLRTAQVDSFALPVRVRHQTPRTQLTCSLRLAFTYEQEVRCGRGPVFITRICQICNKHKRGDAAASSRLTK